MIHLRNCTCLVLHDIKTKMMWWGTKKTTTSRNERTKKRQKPITEWEWETDRVHSMKCGVENHWQNKYNNNVCKAFNEIPKRHNCFYCHCYHHHHHQYRCASAATATDFHQMQTINVQCIAKATAALFFIPHFLAHDSSVSGECVCVIHCLSFPLLYYR